MIAPQVLVLSILLSIAWGTHLLDTVNDYLEVRGRPSDTQRRRGDLVIAFRRMVVAGCLESICLAYVLRTALVLAGFGELVAGQVTFYALLGTNIPGAIFTVLSRRYD